MSETAKRILVADDDASVGQMIARVLTEEGYEARFVVDDRKAVKLLASLPFDLVLVEWSLYGKSGWLNFDKLRGGTPPPVVIILTGRTNWRSTMPDAGVGALLEKPLDFQRLLKTVDDLLYSQEIDQDTHGTDVHLAIPGALHQ